MIRKEKIDEWKEILLSVNNVASEILREDRAKELSLEEKRELLKWSGDEKYVNLFDDGEITCKIDKNFSQIPDPCFSDFSSTELGYLRKLLRKYGGDSKAAKAMDYKLKIAMEDAPRNLSSFIGQKLQYKIEDYLFEIDECEPILEVYKDEEEYKIPLDDLEDIDNIPDDCLPDGFHDEIRFCSICGRPMDRGFTDENTYICSETEFILYMDETYGKRSWKATTEEIIGDDGCYVYQENEDSEWEDTGWYYTEWN